MFDPRSAGMLGMTQELLDERLEEESRELCRRLVRYRHDQARVPLSGRTIAKRTEVDVVRTPIETRPRDPVA